MSESIHIAAVLRTERQANMFEEGEPAGWAIIYVGRSHAAAKSAYMVEPWHHYSVRHVLLSVDIESGHCVGVDKGGAQLSGEPAAALLNGIFESLGLPHPFMSV